MSISFVHLRCHTEYSLEDSILQIKNLSEKAKELKLPALALTDLMNVFAGIKFYRAMNAAGIKPILGMDVMIANERLPTQPFRCTLLCQTLKGYHHLMELVSRAYQERVRHQTPTINKKWFQKKSEGLIVLSGGIKGDIGQMLLNSRQEEALNCLKEWQSLFPGRFYIELQRMGHPMEESYITAVCELAQTYHVPVVATHDIRFLMAEDFEAHEARVCIQQGYTLSDARRPKQYTAEQYLKSTEEMQALFKDIPSALTNTVEIAKRCNVALDLHDVHLPHFVVPSEVDAESYLVQEAQKGLQMRLLTLSQMPHFQGSTDLYHKRLEKELSVINDMGFASYFLIVADFIRWAKAEKIPVGPGRGSGAGSLVAYALEITDVDPLHYGLLFERFLNAERVSLPDFDIDFCMEGRDRVIEYVMNRYGRQAVAQISTFGTMAARAVIRDVGRVLGYPYGMVDAIAKLIPFEVGMTLDKALARDEKSSYSLKGRHDREEEVKLLVDLAKKLEGLARNVGTHAGGVVIAPKALTAFTALYYDADNAHGITQLDKDDLETIGLVKFDFLGLRTLTIIDWAVAAINKKRAKQEETPLDMMRVPLDDKATFKLLQKGEVIAVFQLESRGIRALIKRLLPDHFEDIVALVALFRPGPLQSGMVDDFIQRKHDASQIRYFHPLLEPILSETYGVILYQEQVMQIAQILAGYSLGSADLLRRAMGKKKPAEMAKQRAFFMQGCEKNGHDKAFANTMFDLIEKFAGYGFNKSHSVAYAMLSYQTAWLKANYPAEFMAAVLSSEMEHTEKLSDLLYECRTLGLAVNHPNIQTSQYAFTVNEKGEIEYGLGAIKGLGRSAIRHLLDVQEKSEPFQNLFELCRRIDSDKVNRRALEALVYSGCFDHFGEPRWILSAQLELAMQQASHFLSKQVDMFGASGEEVITHPKIEATSAWSLREQSRKEHSVLGIYSSFHPLACYADELANMRFIGLQEAYQTKQSNFLCRAWLVAIRSKFTARGDKFAILQLEDEKVRIELKLSHDQLQLYREQLIKDTLIILEIESYKDRVRQETRLNIKQLWNAKSMREKWACALRLRLLSQSEEQHAKCLNRLKQHLRTYQGGTCPAMIEYCASEVTVPLLLGDEWKVKPTDELIEALRSELGANNVWLEY